MSQYTTLPSTDGACPVSSPFYARKHTCHTPIILPTIQNSLASLPVDLDEKQGL